MCFVGISTMKKRHRIQSPKMDGSRAVISDTSHLKGSNFPGYTDNSMFYITDRVKELIKFKGTFMCDRVHDRIPSPSSVIGRITRLSSKSSRRRCHWDILEINRFRSP